MTLRAPAAKPMTLRDPAMLIATGFGAGLLPRAPGTWGSLAALPFACVIAWGTGAPGLLAAAVLLFPIGCWAAAVAARRFGSDDPGCIVVDEVVGQWLTLAAAPFDPLAYAIGFVLFRCFDVFKPWPVSWADRRIGGGFGIMLDDVLAAVYAALVLIAGRLILGR
jgi:phosphatidylglycerophosphatase A